MCDAALQEQVSQRVRTTQAELVTMILSYFTGKFLTHSSAGDSMFI